MKLIQLKAKEIPEIRERILKEQNGLCLICLNEPEVPCLDHDHVKKIKGTGRVRGVLCRNCNILLAKLENNCVRYNVKIKNLPFILQNMLNFLKKNQYPYIHPSEAPKPKQLKKTSYNKLKKVYNKKKKFPEYPKSKQLTKNLEKLFIEYNIKPEFYKKK